jgi:Dolichyl-phosphate-mannose-protein mannosyltransferase
MRAWAWKPRCSIDSGMPSAGSTLGCACLGSLSTVSAARAIWLIIAIGSLLRLALAASVGLSVDESYSVAIGRQLALGYFDHPPLHVWLVGEWAKLTGSENPLLVRVPFVGLFVGSTWLMYRLTASVYGERAAFWAVLALNLAPLFTLGIASWVLPDGPMVFFSLLAVWLVVRAVLVTPSRGSGLIWWLAAGASSGLALLSKYLAVFPIIGLFLFLVSSRHRRLLATPGPWLAALVSVLVFTPAILWNASHGWVSFSFQGGRALPGAFSVSRFVLNLAGQLAYLLPWTAVALVSALVQVLRRGRRDDAGWLFACLATGPIACFTVLALWTDVLPHWPAIGWLFAFPPLGERLTQLEQTRKRMLRWSIPVTAGFLVLLLSVTASHARTGWIDRLSTAFRANDPTDEVLDWRDLRSAIARRGVLKPDMVVVTLSWVDAAKVDYALGGDVPVLCLSMDPRHFAFLHDVRAFRGRDSIIVTNARRADWRRLAEPYFQRVEPLDDLELTRGGEPAVTLKIVRGIGLKLPPESTSRLAGGR